MKMEEVSARKTQALASLVKAHCPAPGSILVVGCGDGLEAGILARFFGAKTIGIDLGQQFEFARSAAAPAELLEMDARYLRFENASFDLLYSFHALEHIEDPRRALLEMARVLKPGGTFCIGTPNKRRLIGYLGSPAALADKVSWNLSDLRMRLTGRWDNSLGAHAGFDAPELRAMCRVAFGNAMDITDRYYRQLYARHPAVLSLVLATPCKWLILPCCYMIGFKA
jgi:ubiquinone/menaquinone biosynthesis C-methylase UbiE